MSTSLTPQFITLSVIGGIFVVLCIAYMLYNEFGQDIKDSIQERKIKKEFKKCKNTLEELYGVIDYKISVLDEDAYLKEMIHKYPQIKDDVDNYRQFRNTYFTSDLTDDDFMEEK